MEFQAPSGLHQYRGKSFFSCTVEMKVLAYYLMLSDSTLAGVLGPHYSLMRVEVWAPHLAFAVVGVGEATVYSVVFVCSGAVII